MKLPKFASAAFIPLILLSALGGCGGSAPTARATDPDEALAMIERAQHTPAPLEPVRPEPVSFADADVPGRQIIIPHSIPRPHAGDGCSFFAADAPRQPVLVAVPQFGLMKAGGDWETFASDSGSERVSGNLPVKFSSTKHVLRLADLNDGPDVLTITDKHDRVVYEAKGELRCKA